MKCPFCTLPHLHMHLIPRFKGDVLDPRGGVGWVIVDKAYGLQVKQVAQACFYLINLRFIKTAKSSLKQEQV